MGGKKAAALGNCSSREEYTGKFPKKSSAKPKLQLQKPTAERAKNAEEQTMKHVELVEKMNELFSGANGEIEVFSGEKRVHLGKFKKARMKNEGIIIFDFSEKSIGLMIMLTIFSEVKMETEDGFTGGEICKNVYLGSHNIVEVFNSVVVLFGDR